MAKISRVASASRHLRWGQEVRATINAHAEVNYGLSDQQREVLRGEVVRLDQGLDRLSAAANPYRDYLTGAHVDVRARQRVANFLCDEAQRDANGILRNRSKEVSAVVPGGYKAVFGGKNKLSRVLRAGNDATVTLAKNAASALRRIGGRINGAENAAAALEQAAALLHGFNQERQRLDEQRMPLREATHTTVADLREELDKMDGRLREHFSQAFIDSLYPELTRKNTMLADEPDDQDDDSELPEDAPAGADDDSEDQGPTDPQP